VDETQTTTKTKKSYLLFNIKRWVTYCWN